VSGNFTTSLPNVAKLRSGAPRSRCRGERVPAADLDASSGTVPSTGAAETFGRAEILAVLEQFKQRFPRAFCFPPKPLMIGVDKHLAEAFPELSKSQMKVVMRFYTGGISYLRGFVPGGHRIGLDGEPVAELGADTIEDARRRLEARARAAARQGGGGGGPAPGEYFASSNIGR